MEIIGYVLAVLMGTTLGLFGGGGSLLAVPILIYFFNVPVVEATAYSLIVVGLSATIGSVQKHREGSVRWDVVLKFAIPSLVAVYLTRRYLLPWIPQEVNMLFGVFDKDVLILILFCFLMFLAAYSMLRPLAKAPPKEQKTLPLILLMGEGALVGVLTGLVGAGGGFLIVPVLIIFMGLDMRIAVGTSLVIVAIKSVVGFFGDMGAGLSLDWMFLAGFLGAGLAGLIAGLILTRHVKTKALKRSFGYFILFMAVSILLRELI